VTDVTFGQALARGCKEITAPAEIGTKVADPPPAAEVGSHGEAAVEAQVSPAPTPGDAEKKKQREQRAKLVLDTLL
jgi:hypothetical protein